MAHILMTWEIGQNYGHVLPLLPVARSLRKAGHQVTFALKDLRQVGAMLADEGFVAIPSPSHSGVRDRVPSETPESMADVLRLFGFGSAGVLSESVSAWCSLMCSMGVDMVVASYAPISLLAARSLGLRCALVGMSFELPPPQGPSPAFRPWKALPVETLWRSEKAVVTTVNEVMRPRGIEIESVFGVFAADRHLLWTFPELDPWAEVRRKSARTPTVYCGGVFDDKLGQAVSWPELTRPKILGYLRYSAPRLAKLVAALGGVDASFVLVVPDMDPGSIRALNSANVTVTATPARLHDALAVCDAVLSYGGHGTICASLLRGRPLVLLPEHIEGATIASQVARLGAAALPNPASPDDVAQACAKVLDLPKYREAARRFSRRYEGYDPALQAGRMARVLNEMAPA